MFHYENTSPRKACSRGSPGRFMVPAGLSKRIETLQGFCQRGPRTTLLKKNPPLATGPSQGGNGPQDKSICGSVMCRNSHTERNVFSRCAWAGRRRRDREKAGGRDTVGFSLRLPAQASGAIANLAPSLPSAWLTKG